MHSQPTLILNPNSGSADNNLADEIVQAYRDCGVEVNLQQTTEHKRGDTLAREALEAGARQIIVAGGDGSIMAAVNGLATADSELRKRAVLSIIPAGTANLVARALGIELDVPGAVETSLNGEVRPLDLGLCGSTYFALGMGIGLTEKVISGTVNKEKEKLGRFAYALAMLREMGSPPTKFTYRLDAGPEQSVLGVAVIVANAGDIGNGLQFAPDARLDDGLLDLCVVRRFHGRDVLRLLWKGLINDLKEDRGLTYLQAAEIELDSTPHLTVQIDGEAVDRLTPVRVRCVPAAIKVRVRAASSS